MEDRLKSNSAVLDEQRSHSLLLPL